jgi:C4-dicarboxylate-specific signal transduction histidine kinase
MVARHWQGWAPWVGVGLLIGIAGAVWIAHAELAARREAFDTDARIAHRLLSQRAVEHDAILATLALLQPGEDAESARRLPALYPQLIRVERRERDAAWPQPAWAAAEAESVRLQRAVLAQAALPEGRFVILRAAQPLAYALEIDIERMLPWNDWPLARDGPVRAELVRGGQTWTLHPGGAAAGPWRFEFSKHLAAESQPFDLRLSRTLGWSALPWARIAGWLMTVALVLALAALMQRQRSARRRAEELLRLGQVARLNTLGELAAGLAHELNQPLTALLAGTQAAVRLLADDPPELATARAAMNHAAAQARRAADVVQRLRRAVEQPEHHARRQPVRLDEAVRNALYLLEPECRRHGVTPSLEVGADAPTTVLADPVGLEQVVHNLLANALQALTEVPPAERRLALTITRQGPMAVLAVRDSGPGIAAEHLGRVFEPFFTTRPGAQGGLGLGLSLSQSLVEGFGGSLSAGHAAPRGAEFRVTLPLASTAAA